MPASRAHRALCTFHLVPAFLVGALLNCVGAQALAQSAPRYAWRELAKPTGAVDCTVQSVNEGGEAGGICTYKGGTRMETAKWCLGSFCFDYQARRTWYYAMPTAWTAQGTARALSVPERGTAYFTTMLDTGEAIATGAPMDTNGRTGGMGAAWIWAAGSNVGEDLPVPNGLNHATHVVRQVTPQGRVVWDSWSSGPSLLQQPDGGATTIMDPPATGGRQALSPVINDAGMVLRRYWQSSPAVPGAVPQSWLHDGGTWQQMPMPASRLMLTTIHLNNKGWVAASDVYSHFLWRPDQPNVLAPLPREASPVGINDQGVVIGVNQTQLDSQGRGKAVIWVAGMVMDLSSQVNVLPRSVTLIWPRAINQKGQIVVSAHDSARLGDAANRMMLLTPQ